MAEAVLAAVAQGAARVAVEAVPGAGKSWLLRHASLQRPSLLLAYNAQLARDMREAGVPLCLTFHALCARCLAPARDDAQLEDAVARAEAGALAPRDVPLVELVLIDEAQDVRALYVRLLAVLGLLSSSLLVVGDRHQLVYDFDPDFPATLDTLLAPERALGSAGAEWARAELHESRRLTRPMATFVNAVFGTTIRSARDGPPVEVRAPRSVFDLYACLSDVIAQETAEEGDKASRGVMILTDRKRGNRPLLALINAASRGGARVAVHGMDDHVQDARVTCGTFWSAKGLESDTAVVLLPAAAARNPTFVALTRARRRLVVVLDPREPHAAAALATCACVHSEEEGGPAAVRVRDAQAMRAVRAGEVLDRDASLRAPEWRARRADVSHCKPSRDAMRGVEVGEDVIAADDDDAVRADGRDMTDAAVVAALARAEMRAHGAVRAMEHILQPARMDAAQLAVAVQHGFTGHAAPRGTSDDELLAPDLRAKAVHAYAALRANWKSNHGAAAVVALASLAWNGFDHVMRAAPLEWVWQPRMAAALEAADALLPARDVEYDVMLRAGTHVCRAHARTDAHAVHVVWRASSDDVGAAALRAALHPRGRCLLVELGARHARMVCVRDPALFLEGMMR